MQELANRWGLEVTGVVTGVCLLDSLIRVQRGSGISVGWRERIDITQAYSSHM